MSVERNDTIGAKHRANTPKFLPLKTASPSWQLDFRTIFKNHPGASQSAHDLVAAGADPKELSRLFLWTAVAAESRAGFDVRAAAKVKRQFKKESYAKRKRLSRIPARLRAAADEVTELNSWPRFAPSLAVPEIPSFLANMFLSLPHILRSYAAYIEPGLVWEARKSHRFDPLRMAQVRLLDYIRGATGKPRYEAAADLVTAAMAMGGSKEDVTAGKLRDLKRKNPSLKSLLLSAWPRRRFLERLASKNPSLKSCLNSYPHQ